LQVGFARGLAVQFPNLASFRQPILTVDDDGIT
jgi:hypothetical protein